MNFAVQHLLTAARLSRQLAAVQEANAESPFGEFFEDVLGLSSGCVLLAVASVESYINEVFADREEHFTAHDQAVLDLIWSEFEEKKILEKFDLALILRGHEALDRGSPTVQALDRLIQLRNGLTHFKPEWTNNEAEHEKLSRKLEYYVTRSPWLPSERLFPRAWASAGTAEWAIKAVTDFINEFSTASGLANRLTQFLSRLGVANPPMGG